MSLLSTALYASVLIISYYLLICMQSVLIIHCFIRVVCKLLQDAPESMAEGDVLLRVRRWQPQPPLCAAGEGDDGVQRLGPSALHFAYKAYIQSYLLHFTSKVSLLFSALHALYEKCPCYSVLFHAFYATSLLFRIV